MPAGSLRREGRFLIFRLRHGGFALVDQEFPCSAAGTLAEVDSPNPARETTATPMTRNQVVVFVGLCECRFSVSALTAGEFCVSARSLRASAFAAPTVQPQCPSARRRTWQHRVVGRFGNRSVAANRRVGSPKHPGLPVKQQNQPPQSP